MKSRMRPNDYLAQEVFDAERKKIFQKLWVFAGLKQMLPAHNSFITRSIAGVPVVIQNFRGELRAFENVCLHRNAKLQTQAVGSRPLLCGYHGWGYGADGSVENIPFEKELYRFSKEERECLRLKQFPLEILGNIVFINLSERPIRLEDQFSPEFISSLTDCSTSFDTEVMYTTWHTKFNWKLAHENLRDANHPRFVHPQSLAKYVQFVANVDEPLNEFATPEFSYGSRQDFFSHLRRFSYGGPEVAIENMPHFSWHANVERYGNIDNYYNWLAYPNLHIASGNGGFSFTIEHHIPIAPGKTDLEIYWVTAKKKAPYAFSSNVLLSQMHGSKIVVGEDVEVMESVQAALHADAPTAHQGAYEGLNKQVERWYRHAMGGADNEI